MPAAAIAGGGGGSWAPPAPLAPAPSRGLLSTGPRTFTNRLCIMVPVPRVCPAHALSSSWPPRQTDRVKQTLNKPSPEHKTPSADAVAEEGPRGDRGACGLGFAVSEGARWCEDPGHHPVCQWLWIGSGLGVESESSQTRAPPLLGPPAQPSWVFLRKPGPWAPSLSPRTGHLPSCLKGGQGKDRYPGTCHRDRQAQRPQALGPRFGPRLALPLPAARPLEPTSGVHAGRLPFFLCPPGG